MKHLYDGCRNRKKQHTSKQITITTNIVLLKIPNASILLHFVPNRLTLKIKCLCKALTLCRQIEVLASFDLLYEGAVQKFKNLHAPCSAVPGMQLDNNVSLIVCMVKLEVYQLIRIASLNVDFICIQKANITHLYDECLINNIFVILNF